MSGTIEPVPYSDPDQRRKYSREWKSARRSEFFAGKSCIDCGSTEELELDHIDPTEKDDHKIWTWSAARRAVEIAKCEIRCRACHIERHAKQKRKLTVHGTAAAYRRRNGCRCDLCRAAHREARRVERRGDS